MLPARAAASLQTLVIGYAIGIALAAVLTTVAIGSRIGADLLETLTSMFNPLPAIALLPLALIWFGLGQGSVIFVLVHSVLWAIALNTHSGFRAVSNTLRMVGLNYSYLEVKNPNVHRVANSVDVIGNITLDVVFAPKRFVDANPKTVEAFLAALDEANAFIAEHKQETAEIFARSSAVKISPEEVLEILNDPDTRFSTTPTKVMDFADFMHLAGTIKVKPESWTELFIPQLAGRAGS